MIAVPDTPLATRLVPSPNEGERRGRDAPDLLILHYTGMRDGAAAEQRLADVQAEVSCHYLVHENGEVVQMVAEARRAWHAGRALWAGHDDINSRSVGIEIVNPGHEWGYRPFPAVQMAAVAALSADIVRRLNIRPWHVLAHSDVAPLRKEDPGELFDWALLARAGAGLWVPAAPVQGGRFLSPGDSGAPVEALQAMFGLYGYGVAVTGLYDDLTTSVVRAFQRHFRQDRVDGIADRSTIETLRALIGARQELQSWNGS